MEFLPLALILAAAFPVALVQVAHAAVKSTRSPYYKNKYERISKRRGTAPPLILFIPIQMRFRDPHALILILRAVREI
jgi:hypothetical protein